MTKQQKHARCMHFALETFRHELFAESGSRPDCVSMREAIKWLEDQVEHWTPLCGFPPEPAAITVEPRKTETHITLETNDGPITGRLSDFLASFRDPV